MSLLVLLNQAPSDNTTEVVDIDSAISLLNLNIQDAVSRSPVPVFGYQKENMYIQGLSFVYPPLEFILLSENMSSGESNRLTLQGGGRLCLRLLFTHNPASASVRICFFDKNNRRCVSKLYTIETTSIEENGKYVSEMIFMDSLGAKKISLFVESISAGEVDVYLAEV